MRPDVSVGLALGGGGARGIAHIHVLAALDELGIRPAIVAGTSIGAILGAAYASGMSAADIRDYVRLRLVDRWKLANDLIRAAGARRQKDAQTPGSRTRRRFDLLHLLQSMMPEDFPARFEELEIPTKVVATDFFAQAERVFDSGLLMPALAASAAAPMIFRPVTFDGAVYVDGGATNPVPFDILAGQADIVIAVDIIGDNVARTAAPVGRLDVLTASSHIMQRSIMNAKRAIFEPHALLRPDIDGVRVHDFLRVERILDRTASAKDRFKREIGAALETATGRRP